jgi:hypothetical protein
VGLPPAVWRRQALCKSGQFPARLPVEPTAAALAMLRDFLSPVRPDHVREASPAEIVAAHQKLLSSLSSNAKQAGAAGCAMSLIF